MKYLEAVEAINQLERKLNLMSVKCRGISVWPLLRINLIDKMCERDGTMKAQGGKAIRIVLKTLFAYNPFTFLRKHKIWLFAGYERRKLVGDNNILRISGGVCEAEQSTMVIEKPSQLQLKGKQGVIPEQHIVSESWILLFVHFFAFLFRLRKLIIEDEKLLIQTLDELGVQFDYKSSLRVLLAQRTVLEVLLKVLSCPRIVIIECPYTVMGYIWAFHSKGIRVIEMQHGVLNRQHYAYCSEYHSEELYPDEIWCFGADEYRFLTSDKCHYCNRVEKTGLYFLEVSDKFFKTDIFEKERHDYKHIILVAGQRGYEKVLAEFTDKVASHDKDSLYVYVPRTEDEAVSFSQENVIYKPGVNIYEYMKWCDLHLTISSTTAIECQYFHKPTIFYDYENLGSTYYGSVFDESNGIYYVNEMDDYSEAEQTLLKTNYKYKECFTPGTVGIIRELLNKSY